MAPPAKPCPKPGLSQQPHTALGWWAMAILRASDKIRDFGQSWHPERAVGERTRGRKAPQAPGERFLAWGRGLRAAARAGSARAWQEPWQARTFPHSLCSCPPSPRCPLLPSCSGETPPTLREDAPRGRAAHPEPGQVQGRQLGPGCLRGSLRARLSPCHEL